jgi:hypothetical protein
LEIVVLPTEEQHLLLEAIAARGPDGIPDATVQSGIERRVNDPLVVRSGWFRARVAP